MSDPRTRKFSRGPAGRGRGLDSVVASVLQSGETTTTTKQEDNMNNIDRPAPDLLRKEAEIWAGDISRLGTEGTMPHIAAEFILSLPDSWVDADKLRGIIEEMTESLATPGGDDFAQGHDQATERWRSALEALLPAPRTMADIEWDDEHQGLEAFYKAGTEWESVVRMIFPIGNNNNDGIMCVEKSGRVFTPYPHHLTPIPGTKIDLAPADKEDA